MQTTPYHKSTYHGISVNYLKVAIIANDISVDLPQNTEIGGVPTNIDNTQWHIIM